MPKQKEQPSLLPYQGWRVNRLPDALDYARPQPPDTFTLATWTLEGETYFRLQGWIQLARFWRYVVGRPMVEERDYFAVRDTAHEWHKAVPEECPIPIYWYWNHLPDRYDDWIKQLFSGMQINPLRPWSFDAQVMGLASPPRKVEAMPTFKPHQALDFFPEENGKEVPE